MKCPICDEETIGQKTQRWGPEWAHTRCVKAFDAGVKVERERISAVVKSELSIKDAAHKPYEGYQEGRVDALNNVLWKI